MIEADLSISIIHYHLEPGGVTQVIELSIHALIEHVPEMKEVRLICGRPRGGERLTEKLRLIASQHGVSVVSSVIPEIDYIPADSRPGSGLVDSTNAIKDALLEVCAGSVWLVHNYHIGKNPLLTRALLELVDEHPDERFCFYIHDFPESSRYGNLDFLQRFVHTSVYPVQKNVRYAVINQRDYDYLAEAGLPVSSIFLLNDPVKEEHLDKGGTETTVDTLERAFASRFPGFKPGAPMMLYPVRTIRRKNAMEMGLIAALSPDPLNVVVTLPGTSETEKPYSDLVERAYIAGLIPGMWGIGADLDDAGIAFPELIACSRVICSSSVQEGFGYLFVNAVQWGIPLFARYLPILDGILGVFEAHPHFFYRILSIPIHIEKLNDLKRRYVSKVDSLGSVLPEPAVSGLHDSIEELSQDGTIDFSYLSPDDQFQVLEKTAGDSSYRSELVRLNENALKELSRVINEPVPTATDRSSRWPFSYAAYSTTVRRIVESFESPVAPDKGEGIQKYLIERFAALPYLRLIYGE